MANKPNPFLAGLGLEDNDLNITLNAEHEGEGEDEQEELEVDTSDTPEAAELDVQEASSEVDEASDMVEETEEASEALEALITTMQGIVASGESINAGTAKLFHLGIEHALRKIPGAYGYLDIPSLESFETTPESSMNVSLEAAIEAKEKGLGGRIVATLKKWWDAFVTFLSELLSSVGRTTKKQRAIAELCKGKETTGGKINLSGFFSDGTFTTTSYTNLNKLLEASLKTRWADVQSAVGNDTFDLDAAMSALDNATSVYKAANGTKLGFKGATFNFKDNKASINYSDSSGSGKEITAPTAAECKAVCTEIGRTMEILNRYNSEKGRRKSLKEAIEKALAKSIASSTGEESKRKSRKAAIEVTSKVFRQISDFERKLVELALSASNAGLNVIHSAYKGSKKKDK